MDMTCWLPDIHGNLVSLVLSRLVILAWFRCPKEQLMNQLKLMDKHRVLLGLDCIAA